MVACAVVQNREVEMVQHESVWQLYALILSVSIALLSTQLDPAKVNIVFPLSPHTEKVIENLCWRQRQDGTELILEVFVREFDGRIQTDSDGYPPM